MVKYYVQHNDPTANEFWIQEKWISFYNLEKARKYYMEYCKQANPTHNVRLVSIPEFSDYVFEVIEYRSGKKVTS